MVLPSALAASSLPDGTGVTRTPDGCQPPKPFLPCEMTTAGKAALSSTAVVLEPARVKTAMFPSEQSANVVGDVGVGVGVQTGLCEAGAVVDHVDAAKPSANIGETR